MLATITKDFALEECCACGFQYFIPKTVQDNLKKTKGEFCCPMGHKQSYSKSTAEILKEELEKEREVIRNKISKIDEKDMYISSLERKIKRSKSVKKK